MGGIGISIAIAMAYLGVGQLFEQMGNVNYLPAQVAAWAPDALFSLAGLYLMLRMSWILVEMAMLQAVAVRRQVAHPVVEEPLLAMVCPMN